jgi:hypothetical protein
MKEAPGSSETSVLTRATRRNNPETPFFIVTAVKTSNLTYRILMGKSERDQWKYQDLGGWIILK